MLLFVSLFLAGIFLRNSVLAFFALAILAGIATRYPSARSPYDFSFVSLFAMPLVIVNFNAALIFGFFVWWIARIWNPMEEVLLTLNTSISTTVAILLAPLLISHSASNLMIFSIYFVTVRFFIYSAVITPITRPGTIVTDVLFNLAEFIFLKVYTAVLVSIFGGPLLFLLGLSNWESGRATQFSELFIRAFTFW